MLAASFALAGYLTGFFLELLLVALCLYVLWVFWQLHSLERWTLKARRRAPPTNNFRGIWSEIADDVALMHSRHAKEKQRLQAVVSRVQDMTAALTDGVVLVDPKSNIEWWNKATERLLGLQTTDLGHKITNLVRHPRFVDYFESADYSQPLVLANLRREHQQLEFQVHRFGEGNRILVVRDITQLFKLEQMRKDFVANVSHELRTPLTVIRGYLETLAGIEDLPAPWSKCLQQMEQQSQRMTGLINDLITLSNLETANRDTDSNHVQLAPLIAAVIADARTISGEREHKFILSDSDKLVLIGNERELRSALSNLVVNAVNYSPAGTTVEIICETNNDSANVLVRDQGIGIDPKHIPRLTERFYRVDSSRSVASGGTGLGLAIAKHVLLRHDAELRITSELGKGSCFCCCFPVTRVVR